MASVFFRLRRVLGHAMPIHRYARLILAAIGTIWLVVTEFHRMDSLRQRYGASRLRMAVFMLSRISMYKEALPGRNEQIYLSQGANYLARENYSESWRICPSASLLLFLANSFKVIGLLDAAVIIYRMAEKKKFKTDVVLSGLGDLFLVEGSWTIESQVHLEAGSLHDAELALSLRNRTPAWKIRPLSDSADELRSAVDINPLNRSAWWLLVCALMKMRLWEEGRAALQRYLSLAPALYEQNMAGAIVDYGIDSIAGRVAMEKNLGRWLGWFHVSEVEIVDSFSSTNHGNIKKHKLTDAETLQVTGHVVTGGQISYYERLQHFENVFHYSIPEAEILPSYGMVVSEGRYLLSDSAHIYPIHWHRYTPSIMSVREKNALICREIASPINVEDAIYFGNNANYYHFICEDLPRLLLLEERLGMTNRPILVSHTIRPWQENLLIKLGIEPSRWKAVNFGAPLELERLSLPATLSRNLVVHPLAINLIRNRLLGAERKLSSPGKRLYLQRGSNRDRSSHFLNEADIERQLYKSGFSPVSTGGMTIDEQIELFSDAEIIAGPGGAAFTNLIFAPATCSALLFASSADAGDTFGSLASSIGQEYFVCVGDGYPQPSLSWINTSFDFSIDPLDVSLALEKIQLKNEQRFERTSSTLSHKNTIRREIET